MYSKFNFTKLFWQISLKPIDYYKTALSVPQGLYEWKVLPFIPYIDDILVFSQNPGSHVEHL